ncbi:MAG: hypothetical protein JXR07_03970 [Reichenbachiella sp.]
MADKLNITCTVGGTAPNYTLALTNSDTGVPAEDVTVDQKTQITWSIEGPDDQTTVITGVVKTGGANIFDGPNGHQPGPKNANDPSVWNATVESVSATESETYCIHFKVGDTVCNHDPAIKVNPK